MRLAAAGGAAPWMAGMRPADNPRKAAATLMHIPARGPPTDWGELVQVDDDRDIFQGRIDDLPAIDIHSL
jgi:hypothetical protein